MVSIYRSSGFEFSTGAACNCDNQKSSLELVTVVFQCSAGTSRFHTSRCASSVRLPCLSGGVSLMFSCVHYREGNFEDSHQLVLSLVAVPVSWLHCGFDSQSSLAFWTWVEMKESCLLTASVVMPVLDCACRAIISFGLFEIILKQHVSITVKPE